MSKPIGECTDVEHCPHDPCCRPKAKREAIETDLVEKIRPLSLGGNNYWKELNAKQIISLCQQHFLEEALEVVEREKSTDNGYLSDHDKLSNHRMNRVIKALTNKLGGGE